MSFEHYWWMQSKLVFLPYSGLNSRHNFDIKLRPVYNIIYAWGILSCLAKSIYNTREVASIQAREHMHVLSQFDLLALYNERWLWLISISQFSSHTSQLLKGCAKQSQICFNSSQTAPSFPHRLSLFFSSPDYLSFPSHVSLSLSLFFPSNHQTQ